MNTHEACSLLGVQIGASDADVKAAFKRKAIEYHPDRNKAANAEDKFKEINAAFQFLEKYGTSQPSFNDIKSPFYSPADDFAEEIKRQMDDLFNKRVTNQPSLIEINVEIPFELAVSGGKQDIKYVRLVKCQVCKNGKIKVTCQKCNGTGKRRYGAGSVVKPVNDRDINGTNRELPCNGCVGSGMAQGGVCKICKGTSSVMFSETIQISIRPGSNTGTRQILRGMGNYRVIEVFDGLIKNTKEIIDDLVVIITVKPSINGLTLVGDDVISTVELNLLEALQGTKKKLHTVRGEKILEFKPKIKNGDKIRVSGFGVSPNGAHIFIISVKLLLQILL